MNGFYHNSTFRIKEGARGLKRTQMKRVPGTARLQKSTLNRSQKPMNRYGKKTKANKMANAQLKREFEVKGVTTCELGYRDCTRDDFLSWAHGKKRRKLQGDELTTCVILACINCHDVIERMSPESMLAIVESVIAERGWN